MNRYRIMECGIDCGPVTSWSATLAAIDDSEHGDGTPSIWDREESQWITRAEVAARAACEAADLAVIEARAEWDRISMTARGDRHDSAQRRYLHAIEFAAATARGLDALLRSGPL